MAKRNRNIGSIKLELARKAKDAAICAIKIFNDPLITFKAESFIVLMIISWTYLLHGYYHSKGIDYRYYQKRAQRKVYDKTKRGSYKYWELERCLNEKLCPIGRNVKNNLLFLIGLRNEIEHQLPQELELYLSGRFQACVINFNDYLKKYFREIDALDQQLAYSIQFLEISEDQVKNKTINDVFPKNLSSFITEFDDVLTHEEYNSPKYSFRLVFKQKMVNKPGQADRVIEFIDPKSDLAKQIDKEFWVKKEVERPKFRAKDLVKKVQKAGFKKFRIQPEHVNMWKQEDAKNPGKGFGVEIQGCWYWYENWISRCIELCENEGNKFR